jgi:HK97 family phage prohead protease
MTFHRALGFVDRASLTDDSPLRVVMASEGRMADKIDLRMSGADLGRFRGNPVLGYGHSYYGRTNLPIGRVDPESLTIADRQLSGEIQFDQGDEFAREVERKMRAGYLNAVSIGFDVTQWESAEDNYWRGGVASKWELSELSVVPVPMDSKALVTSGRGFDPMDPTLVDALSKLSEAEFEKVRERMRFLRQVAGPPAADGIVQLEPHGDSGRQFAELLRRMVADLPASTPEPPVAGVPTDSARGLLDAFTITKESHA